MSYVIILEYPGELRGFDARSLRESLAQLREMLVPQPKMVYAAIDDSAAAVIDLMRYSEVQGSDQVYNQTIRGGLGAGK